MIKNSQKSLAVLLVYLVGCSGDDTTPDRVLDSRSLYTVSTLTGLFDGSGGLSVDRDGFIYVANFGGRINNADGREVLKIDPITGRVSTFAEGLVGPSGNTFHVNGNLFQSNIAGNTISEITPEGEVQEYTSEGLSSPVGVVFDGNGNLYVCNCGAASIQKITPEGVSSRFVSDPLLNCPNGLTIDNDGNLYAANFNNANIIKVNPDQTLGVFASIPGGSNAHLVFHDEHLFVLSRGGNKLYKVSLEAQITLIAGTGATGNEDGSGEEASFNIPNGIGVSPDGSKIYVVSEDISSGNSLNPVLVRVIEAK